MKAKEKKLLERKLAKVRGQMKDINASGVATSKRGKYFREFIAIKKKLLETK